MVTPYYEDDAVTLYHGRAEDVGSGTTGLAAKRLGRRAVLVEAEEKHCESAALRLKREAPIQLVPVTAPEPFDFGGDAA